MNKNRFLGFTILELIITTLLMAVIMVIAPVVMLKRNVKPSKTTKLDNIAECTSKCVYMAKYNTLKTQNAKIERFDYNKNSGGLYTIELVGGGGSGTANSVGYPGEFKKVNLLSLEGNETNNYDITDGGGILTGYYLMEVGEGGNSGKSGSPSVICIISQSDAALPVNSLSCNNKTIIAKAEGGITSSEIWGSDLARISKYGTETGSYAGNGGQKGQKGNNGIIVIK